MNVSKIVRKGVPSLKRVENGDSLRPPPTLPADGERNSIVTCATHEVDSSSPFANTVTFPRVTMTLLSPRTVTGYRLFMPPPSVGGAGCITFLCRPSVIRRPS